MYRSILCWLSCIPVSFESNARALNVKIIGQMLQDIITLLETLLLQIILEAGVDVNIRNVQNTIPLHVALARGAKSCVGLLLSAGSDCNMQVCC